jgi:AcrR family transcriptional regulator
VSPKISPAGRETPTVNEAPRRAQIIEAATATIADLGYINASLAQLAKRAGISKSVIGYYFPSKDDLVKAVVEAFFMTGHTQMMAKLSPVTDPEQMLRTYIRENIAYITQNPAQTRAIGDIITNCRDAEGTPIFKLQDSEPMVEGTAAMFRWGQEAGSFREFDPRVMAIWLRGCIDYFGHQFAAYPDLDVDHYANEMADMFWHAARKS